MHVTNNMMLQHPTFVVNFQAVSVQGRFNIVGGPMVNKGLAASFLSPNYWGAPPSEFCVTHKVLIAVI